MDNTPLGMQFLEFDTDKDGKITAGEAHDLMKLLGKNVYPGTVNNVRKRIMQVLKMINYQDPSAEHFTFEQFKEYFESYETTPKHDIWKAKYELLSGIYGIKMSLNKSEGDSAAPGCQKSENVCEATSGQIKFTVGPVNQNYDCLLQLNLVKEKKEESKPFIKLVFDQASSERAKNLEILIKQLHDNLVNMVKEMQPEYGPLADSFNVLTNVIDCRLNVFITTSNNDLIELGLLLSQGFDIMCDSKSQAKLHFKHQFSANIDQFMDKHSNYTFYNAITHNTMTSIDWMAMYPKEFVKAILKANDAFSQLKYESVQPFCLTLIGLLHLESAQCSFAFDNAEL